MQPPFTLHAINAINSNRNKYSKTVPLPTCRRQGGEEMYLILILDLGTRWGEWSASRSDRVLPLEKDPRYPLDRKQGASQSWVRLKACLDTGRTLCLRRGSNPGRPFYNNQTLYWLSYTSSKCATEVILVVYFTTLSQYLDYITLMMGLQVNDDEQKRSNINALSGIWTHSLSVQAIKAYASTELR
jgi:hypothetical protein